MDDYIQMSPDMVDAKQRGDIERILELVEGGEDLRAIDYQEGWTLLHWAAHNGHAELARVLLDRGADKEVEDEEAQTPLMLAASAGHLGLVQLLLDRGADPAAETHGWDASDYARTKNHTAIQLLLATARKKAEPAGAAEKRSHSKFDRLQVLDAEVALEQFLARPDNRDSTDPLVGVWQTVGSAQVYHADGTVTVVSHGGRFGGGPYSRWSATEDGEFIYDSTPLGPSGKVSHQRWRLSDDGRKLFLTNEFGGAAVLERKETR